MRGEKVYAEHLGPARATHASWRLPRHLDSWITHGRVVSLWGAWYRTHRQLSGRNARFSGQMLGPFVPEHGFSPKLRTPET